MPRLARFRVGLVKCCSLTCCRLSLDVALGVGDEIERVEVSRKVFKRYAQSVCRHTAAVTRAFTASNVSTARRRTYAAFPVKAILARAVRVPGAIVAA